MENVRNMNPGLGGGEANCMQRIENFIKGMKWQM